MLKTIKNMFKYLFKGAPVSAIINFIWHITSITPCSTIERIEGWVLVWFVVSAAIYTYKANLDRISSIKRFLLGTEKSSCVSPKSGIM